VCACSRLGVKSGSFRIAILTSRFRYCGEYSHTYWELSPYNKSHPAYCQTYSAVGTTIFALQKCLTSSQSHGFHIISICSTFYSNIALHRISANTRLHIKHNSCISSPPRPSSATPPPPKRHTACRSAARSSAHTMLF